LLFFAANHQPAASCIPQKPSAIEVPQTERTANLLAVPRYFDNRNEELEHPADDDILVEYRNFDWLMLS
jgi:hypothetical protein